MLTIFQFKDNDIRFVDGKPVANDVAKVLGYADPTNTIRKKVKAKYKGVAKISTPGGIQSVIVLEEPGVYQLTMGSKLPSAEEFQDWLFEEVLPQIRKTGSYSVNHQPVQQQLPQRDTIDYVKATMAVNQMEDSLLTRLLKDSLVDELSLKRNQLALPEKKKNYTIAKVRAKQLGYTEKQIGSGSALGNFVAKQLECEFVETVGRYAVKHYEVNEQLDSVIHAYFLERRV